MYSENHYYSNLNGVCWIGGARYDSPLNSTDDKKWVLLAQLKSALYVIGFARNISFIKFDQHAHFYLLPLLPLALLRYVELALVSPLIALRLIFTKRVQVLVAQSPYEGVVAACIKIISSLFGQKVVLIIESHGDFENDIFMYKTIPFSGLIRWLMGRLARFSLAQANVLRTISANTSGQIKLFAQGKPEIQFMAWTDLHSFLDVVRETPLSLCKEIVYAGVLIPRKGVHILLDAFNNLRLQYPGIKLTLVGHAHNSEYTVGLHQQVSRLNLENDVQFYDHVSQGELGRIIARSRVLVLPSLSEGLGRVLVEAMLCGTPVIGSDVGGIPDIIKDEETGYLVKPGDVASLTGALEKVFNDPDIDGMGKRAREFAQSFFSPEKYLEGYGQLLDIADHILSAEA